MILGNVTEFILRRCWKFEAEILGIQILNSKKEKNICGVKMWNFLCLKDDVTFCLKSKSVRSWWNLRCYKIKILPRILNLLIIWMKRICKIFIFTNRYISV